MPFIGRLMHFAGLQLKCEPRLFNQYLIKDSVGEAALAGIYMRHCPSYISTGRTRIFALQDIAGDPLKRRSS